MSDTPPRTLRIFLAHAHEDQDEVLALYQRLQDDGFQPWIDNKNLIPGQRWKTAIRKAVKACDAFVICVSQHSATKQGFVQREIVFALDVAKEQPEDSVFLIPVRMEDCIVPDRVSEWHWCNYFEPDGYDKLVEALCLRAEQLGISLIQPEPQPVATVEHPATTPKPPPVVQPVAVEPLPQPQLQPPTPPAQPTAKIRKVLTEGFDDEDLTLLCYDYYREVHDQFAAGMTKRAKIHALITYCEQRSQLTALVEFLRKERPVRAATIFGEQVPAVPIPAASSPTPESSPPVHPSQPIAIPDPIRRTNRLFPVTIAEWHAEEELCNTDFGKPAGYWCYVPLGDYKVGGWGEGDKAATITLSGFWIAKYPVTVQQYRQFMDAGGYENESYWIPSGYENESYWIPKGWQWKQQRNRIKPYRWDDARFSADDQPVVGLSLYEATAFAAWLDAELASNAPHGTRIRLPTEAEWEVAAAYDASGKRRTYPWGEQKPDATRVDCGKKYSEDKPSPIGNHAAGAAACGAENMGGSVWECTTSDYTTYPAASSVVVEDCKRRVAWRGGSWASSYTLSSCSSRPARFGLDFDYLGVRLARLFS